MNRRFLHALMLASLLMAGCAGTPETTDAPSYMPEVSDQRRAPSVAEKVRENGNVRYFVSEAFFGPSLIDIFHREMALHAPRMPTRKRINVTEIEVSILASGTSYLIDPSHDMLGRNKAELAPALMVLDETDTPDADVVRVRIAYQVNGRPHEELLTGSARGAEQARQRAGELYRDAIGRVIGRLRQNG